MNRTAVVPPGLPATAANPVHSYVEYNQQNPTIALRDVCCVWSHVSAACLLQIRDSKATQARHHDDSRGDGGWRYVHDGW